MSPRLRNILASLFAATCLFAATVAHSAATALQVAVLENAPPMAFRDADGRLTGFSVEVARAVCAEMKARCEFQAMVLDRVVDALAGGELGAPLFAGVAQAPIAPINTGLHLQHNREFQRPGLAATVMTVAELVGTASFGIKPRRPELKVAVDDALERIKRNGDYERIDTQFLPFRVH